MSSRDVRIVFSRAKAGGHTILTSRDLMWCYACSWDVRGDLPLNSMAQIHTSVTLLMSLDLTCQHASHISVVAHISWDVTTWPCRVLFGRYQSAVCRKTYCLCRRLNWNRYIWNVISPDCLAPKAHMRYRDMICVCAASDDVSIVFPRPNSDCNTNLTHYSSSCCQASSRRNVGNAAVRGEVGKALIMAGGN